MNSDIQDLKARRKTGTAYEQLVNESRISAMLENENADLKVAVVASMESIVALEAERDALQKGGHE